MLIIIFPNLSSFNNVLSRVWFSLSQEFIINLINQFNRFQTNFRTYSWKLKTLQLLNKNKLLLNSIGITCLIFQSVNTITLFKMLSKMTKWTHPFILYPLIKLLFFKINIHFMQERV